MGFLLQDVQRRIWKIMHATRACWTPAYIASLSDIMPFVHFETIAISIFIPTMKYKSIVHNPILSHHPHSHPFQSSSKNIFITMSDSSASSTLKSTIDQSSKSSPFPLGHSLRDLKPELWHSWLEFVYSVRIPAMSWRILFPSYPYPRSKREIQRLNKPL